MIEQRPELVADDHAQAKSKVIDLQAHMRRRLKRSTSKGTAIRELTELQDRHNSLLMLLSAIVRCNGRQEFTRSEVETSNPADLIFDVGDLICVRLR